MKTELAIVGAGPAGMAAAKVATRCGISTTVIDEQRAPGGQFLRQPPPEFRVSNWLQGSTYQAGKKWLREVATLSDIDWKMQTSVAGLLRSPSSQDGFELILNTVGLASDGAGNDHDGDSQSLQADAVLLAPGCFDMPAQFPGWNLPGVMAAGGIQAFIKSQQFVPGQKFLLTGSHPLQLVVADQIIQAGGAVAAVLFSQSRKRALGLLGEPFVVMGNAAKFGQIAGILWRLRRAGVPVKFNTTVLQANGDSNLRSVTTVAVAADGKLTRDHTQQIECDRLGVCFGFLTSAELARQAGAECTWDPERGGFLASHDNDMQSSVANLLVAGEITGVAGADVAALEGHLAALQCAVRFKKISVEQARQLMAPARRQLTRQRRFARLLNRLAWPGTALLDQLMTESATLCKCEEVRVGDLTALLRVNPHISTANAAKLLSRVGMGLCQGRYCHYGLVRIMASQLDIAESALGGFAARFPAKPVAIDRFIDE